ncbi:TPA: hypothetical protein ACJIK4_003267 [Kluyvera cryocrescens]
MNDITALAQSHELLIANGNETANLLRHLANNEIDSDYFAVVSECESYGQETEAELSITDFALRAAGYVEALVEALEARDKQIAKYHAVLNSLAFVARRYLPDYDEHPEIQAADELLESAAGVQVIEGEA